MSSAGGRWWGNSARWSAPALLALAAGCAGAAEVAVWDGDGVPAPQPVTSRITLGAYIFPGWYRDTGRGDYPYRTHDEDSEWRLVGALPKPRPLLGFYDDSLPEVNDWHIKWALEHGISFFCFDWYWNAGEHRLLRTLEEGFLKARYAPRMKFCIHWCNHGLDWQRRPWRNPGLDYFQTQALVEMTEYLAEHYFALPNYLTVDGRPVLLVWDTARLVEANGGPAGFVSALEAMNAVLQKHGRRDLYLVAVGERRGLAEAGFSALTGYGYYGTDYDSEYEWRGGYSIPYEAMVTHYETVWRGIRQRGGLPYILPIGSNWDSRPRARDRAAVIAGKTPATFADHCARSLKYIDERTGMAIIEAWNEWGEGSFIEPDKEWGFAFLDAVRACFTTAPAEHVDQVPSPARIATFSVLKGDELTRAHAVEGSPWPDPPLSRRRVTWSADAALPPTRALRAWEFAGDTSEGWVPYQVEPFTVRDSILATTATGGDPQLIVDNAGVAIADIQCIALRLRVPEGTSSCQLFWSTVAEPGMTADKCMTFPIRPDGQWHEYLVSRQPEGKWSGTLKILRFDVGAAGDRIEVDWVRLYGKAP